MARLWFDGVLRDPRTAEDLQLKLVGPVYYVRVYGEDDVIATWLVFTLLPR